VVDPGRRQQRTSTDRTKARLAVSDMAAEPGADSGFILARRAGWRRCRPFGVQTGRARIMNA
jgi:hypothetical protein